jgi:hypothetical protein
MTATCGTTLTSASPTCLKIYQVVELDIDRLVLAVRKVELELFSGTVDLDRGVGVKVAGRRRATLPADSGW